MTWPIDRTAPKAIRRITPEETSPPWKRATAAAHVSKGAPRPKIGYKNRPGPRSVARWCSAIARSPIFLRAGSWVIALSRLAPASSPFRVRATARRASSKVEGIEGAVVAVVVVGHPADDRAGAEDDPTVHDGPHGG